MKKLLINGITDRQAPDYSEYERKLEQDLSSDTYYFKLRDMDFNYCQGCWDCWMKTPGKCRLKDDYEQILSVLPHVSELRVITGLVAGYEPALVKKFKDRIIPFAHPYIEILKGECHHKKRYPDSDIKFHLQVLTDDGTDPRSLDIIKEAYMRVALNFHSSLASFTSGDYRNTGDSKALLAGIEQ